MNEVRNYTPESLTQIANESVSVVIQKFCCSISKVQPATLVCFVEGHDLPYYNSRVEAISGRHCVFIDSGGKKNVIRAYHYFCGKSQYSDYKKLYFVDRDYDDNTDLPDEIYVTPCYSVENLCVSENSFIKIMKGIYRIDIDNPKLSSAISFFKMEREKFVNATSLFCAWYKCVKKLPGENSVKLSESFPQNVALIGPYHIMETSNNLKYINGLYPNIAEITNDAVSVSLEEIDGKMENIRGKYVFDFIEYLTGCLNRDSKGCQKFTDGKTSLEKNRKTLLARLSPYADTPKNLSDYVRLNAYNKN